MNKGGKHKAAISATTAGRMLIATTRLSHPTISGCEATFHTGPCGTALRNGSFVGMGRRAIGCPYHFAPPISAVGFSAA